LQNFLLLFDEPLITPCLLSLEGKLILEQQNYDFIQLAVTS